MSAFDGAPVFGRRVEGVPCVVRPSAYVLVRRTSGELALVRAPGGLFLPGGGIDAGETPEAAAVREALEECGLVVRIEATLGRAIEIAHSTAEGTCFEKRSTFLVGEIVGTGPTRETDHELVWTSAERAANALEHGSQRWAVRQLLERR